MTLSIDEERAFGEIQHPFMTTTYNKMDIEGKCINIIKAIYDKPSANDILSALEEKHLEGALEGRHPYNSDIVTLKVVPEVPKLVLIFWSSCFFILFWLNVYFFLLFQIVDLNTSFLPITVGSLCILLYFTLYSLYCFLHFATELNQFCGHPDLPAF